MREDDIQPHDSFIDITPVIRDPFGVPVQLGTVRYRVPWRLVGGLRANWRQFTQGVELAGYPNGALSAFFQCEVYVSDAEVPQPESVVAQELSPLVHDYPGLRHG